MFAQRTFSPPTLTIGFFAFILFLQTIATKPALEVGTGILALCAAIYFMLTKTPLVPSRRLVAVCGIILGFIIASCFYGIHARDAIHQLPRWVAVFGCGTVLITFAQTMPLPTRKQWFTLIAAFAMGIIYMISADQTDYVLQYALKGSGFDASDLNKPIGVMTMMAPALLAPFVFSSQKRDQQIAGGLFILLAAVVVPSYAQSALLSLMVILLCFFMPITTPAFWKLVRLVTVVGLIGLPFVMTPLYEHYADTLKQTDVMRQAASAERLEIWSAVSQRIFEHPVFGWGYNAARVLEMPIANVYFHDPIIAHPHNFVLQIWLESGAVGIAIAAILFTLLWRGIEREENVNIRRLYFTSTASTIAFALVGWNMWQTWWMITLFLIGFLTIISARIIRTNEFANGLKESK